MRKAIEVVDDFYPRAATIRAQALASEWEPAGTGVVVAESAPDLAVVEQVSRLAGTPLSLVRTFFSATLAPTDEQVRQLAEADWAAVIFLSLPEHCQGGLSFFQAAPDRQSDPIAGLPELPVAGANGSRPSDHWEETMQVPMAFNRLVLLSNAVPFSSVNHRSAGTPEDGRLSQVLLLAATPA